MIVICVKGKRYLRERAARDDLRFFEGYGGSIHRRGASRELDLIAAVVRRPDRLPAVLKGLRNLRPDLQFEVKDWRGVNENGMVARVVTIDEAIAISRSADYLKEPAIEPAQVHQDDDSDDVLAALPDSVRKTLHKPARREQDDELWLA